jgi:AmiR/NasT family two-component response regulator
MMQAIDDLESRADVDRALIHALQAEGVVDRERITELRDALVTARAIGCAIGIIMLSRELSEPDAFTVLVRTSQNTNRKLRSVAAELCASRDVSNLAP